MSMCSWIWSIVAVIVVLALLVTGLVVGESWIGTAAVGLAGIGLAIYTQHTQRQRERDRIRYGVVYTLQFEKCRELYTRHSRLRDAIEGKGCIDAKGQKRSIHKCEEDFQRSLKQNDVVLRQDIVDELYRFWDHFKSKCPDDANGAALSPEVREELLASFDKTRDKLRPYMRKEFGIDPEA